MKGWWGSMKQRNPSGRSSELPQTDPEGKTFIPDRNDPTPVFRKQLLRLKAIRSQTIRNELSQGLSVSSGVDVLVFAVISWKSVGPKLNVRLHEVRP
jgi:hypothetical protein